MVPQLKAINITKVAQFLPIVLCQVKPAGNVVFTVFTLCLVKVKLKVVPNAGDVALIAKVCFKNFTIIVKHYLPSNKFLTLVCYNTLWLIGGSV